VDSDLFESLRVLLPPYLTPRQHRDLYEELRRFPNNPAIYTSTEIPDDFLQGDGWRGFSILNFSDNTPRLGIAGIVLSNSCDVSVQNARALPTWITFAPLMRVSDIAGVMRERGRSDSQVQDATDSIRRQEHTSMFCLPEIAGVLPESVALLDQASSQPMRTLNGAPRDSRLFRLNQYGFYIFVVKLSIHWCRFQEGISRMPGA
jgi:hypothetical protein